MGEMEGEAEKERVFIEGYAAVWNSESKLLSEKDTEFIEIIAPMAFTKALENLPIARMDCVATYDHDRKSLLARTRSGTLQLRQDEVGLFFSFEVPDISGAEDLVTRIERRDIEHCSFIAKYNPRTVKTERRNGVIYRTIVDFDEIRDVSMVVDAAYTSTSVDEISRAISEFEQTEAAKAESDKQLQMAIEAQKQMLNQLISKV